MDRVGAKNILVVAGLSTAFVLFMDYIGLLAKLKEIF